MIGPSIIGLMGPKHGGKDTVSQFMMELDPSFNRVAFADVMKSMSYAIDPWVFISNKAIGDDLLAQGDTYDEALDRGIHPFCRLSIVIDTVGWERAKSLTDVRRFLQRLGTEGGRDCLYPDVWVDNTWSKDVVPIRAQGNKVVITDVRFANEIKRVRERGGDIWRVDRDVVEDGDPHPSEREWRAATPDLIIKNNGTIGELAHTVALALGHKPPFQRDWSQ